MADIDDMMEDQSITQRLLEKGRRSPFLVAGVLSCAGMCVYGAYNFKRKKSSTQMYLLQMRVVAQGTAIACLTFGMIYHMFKKHVLHDKNEP